MSNREWTEIMGLMPGGAFDTGAPLPVAEIVKATGEWRRSKEFETGWPNFAEKLMLVVTEVGEASEAARKARICASAMRGGGAPGSLLEAGTQFSAAIKNLAEEWIDVMVRLFDLIDGCELPLDISFNGPLEILEQPWRSEGEETLTTIGEILDREFYRSQDLVIGALTNAMETFRDMRLTEQRAAPIELQEEKLEVLALFLYTAAALSGEAVAVLGEDWPTHYARKMAKNEIRSVRHGRQR